MNHKHLLWLDLNWPWWVFILVAVVVLIALAVLHYNTLTRLAYALVFYLGVYWLMWRWVPLLFWIAVVVGFVGFVVYQVSYDSSKDSGSRLALACGRIGSYVAAFIVTVMLIVSFGSALWNYLGDSSVTPNAMTPNPTVSASPSSSGTGSPTSSPTATEVCPATWEIKYVTLGQEKTNRYDPNGSELIQSAKTDAEAKAAAQDWVNKRATDPITLKGAIHYYLHKDVAVNDLVDGKCVSADAKAYVTEIRLVIANAKVTPDKAPSDGYNSGVSGHRVVASQNPGITGNRKAIKIVSGNYVTWIMARCGNIVTRGKPPVPPGKTDQPPVRPSTPPTTPTTTRSTPSTPSTTTTTTPSTTTTTTPSTTTTTCSVCVTKPSVSQTVPVPATHSSSVPTTEPTRQPTSPANTSSPAPSTSDGYNGGSTSQPGTTAPAPTQDTSSATTPVGSGGHGF